MATVLRIAGALVVAYVIVVALVWRFQERLAFPGARARLPLPASRGIPDGTRIDVETSDSVRLAGWYLPPHPPPAPGDAAPGLIWFYGNMETVGGLASVIRDLRPPGIGLVIIDYRGYGESAGAPTEAGVYRDAEAAWRYLSGRPEIDSTRIAVYGRSIGSAVAMHLATTHAVRAVVLDSPLESGRAMARHHYWWLPSFIGRLSLDNVSRAQALQAPLLVFHGANDAIAPVAMGRKVAAAGRAERFVEIPGAGHNDTYDAGGAAYRDTLHAFLGRHLR